MALRGSIYDVTAFIPHHPGSEESLLHRSGRDATAVFEDVGHSKTAWETGRGMKVVDAVLGLGREDIPGRRAFRENYLFER